MTEDQKITILHMATNLKTWEGEERSVTDIYNELIACVKEDKEND